MWRVQLQQTLQRGLWDNVTFKERRILFKSMKNNGESYAVDTDHLSCILEQSYMAASVIHLAL